MSVNVIIIGPPGSGVRTQAQRLARHRPMPILSSGLLLREAVADAHSPLGRRAKLFLDAGKPIPDEIIVQLVNERISFQDCHGGFILIHCPNSAAQCSALDAVMEKRGSRIHAVVELVCDQDELLSERVSTKLVHAASGRSYNTSFDAPREAGIDDVTGEPLEHSEAEIWKFSSRLSRYRAVGCHACDLYRDKGILFQFDAAQDVSEITKGIVDTVIPLGGTGKLTVPWFDGRRTDQVHISGPKPLYTTLYTNYTSNERFRREMQKHDRQKFGPRDKYADPVTANHDIGWTCLDPEVYKRDPRLFHPRQMSKEVQYQNALLLGPRHL
jgi:adenylate kinase